MFFDEEDEIFGGTPRSKFFDIIFNANRNLVEFEIEKMIEKLIVYENMLEKQDENFRQKANSLIFEKQDTLQEGKNDFYMTFVGDVLSSHE